MNYSPAVTKDYKNIYTFVDGILLSPLTTAKTLEKNTLQIGVSSFYYRHQKDQNNILYYPYKIRRVAEDILLNLSIEYGLFNSTDISIIIPIAPDWNPTYGSNRTGIADITLLLKQYLFDIKGYYSGICMGYKFNTSTYPDILNWYGTDNANLIINYIFSSSFTKFHSFMNFGVKRIVGKRQRPAFDIYSAYNYSNTYTGAIGFIFTPLNNIGLTLESNYESHNKERIKGYFLDICGGFKVKLNSKFSFYGKVGKNLSQYTPFLYSIFGMTVTTPLEF